MTEKLEYMTRDVLIKDMSAATKLQEPLLL